MSWKFLGVLLLVQINFSQVKSIQFNYEYTHINLFKINKCKCIFF